MKKYTVRFDRPAEDSIFGWKNESLPISNSYTGVCIFGGTDYERLQITEPSLWTANCGYIERRFCSGQETFGDLFIDFHHTGEVENYSRSLCLNTAVASVKYTCGGCFYEREYFSSYKAKITAVRLSASGEGNLSFTCRPEIANLRERLTEGNCPENSGKSGKASASGDTITLSGHSQYYGIDFEAQFRVVIDGKGELVSDDKTITVKNANSAYIYFTVGTNYIMDSRAFIAPRLEKLAGNPHPHEKLLEIMENASKRSYDDLKTEHISDHSEYFSNCELDIGGDDDTRDTPTLIQSYRDGSFEPYLEELFFQMGRYMMIATSREGTLPSGVQGKWNAYKIVPWTCGYWYNINQQMNYWFVFSLGLGKLYNAYADFNKVRYEKAKLNGDAYIRNYCPDKFENGNSGENGWIVGTANSPYEVSGVGKSSHSGPGTGGFTVISDVDRVRYTEDIETVKEVYPVLESLARFYLKCMDKYDGKYLASVSASPEQKHDGQYVRTVGCAFDQQMIQETFDSLLEMYDNYSVVREICNEKVVNEVREKISLLDPVLVGYSGQVKEFREENYYGEIGEWEHRHVSQLVGLYPGNVINDDTPAWLDAAKITLKERGSDKGPGFGVMHRALLWARACDGEMAYKLLNFEISCSIFDNLWGCHYDPMPVDRKDRLANFQIDANFGACALVSEMLLQSHRGILKILPALPSTWKKGSIKHFIARGGFDVSLDWDNGYAQRIEIISTLGATLKLRYYNISKSKISALNSVKIIDKDTVEIATEKGEKIVFFDILSFETASDVPSLTAVSANGVTTVKWDPSPDENAAYGLWRAFDSAKTYEYLGEINGTEFVDKDREGRQTTYKVVALSPGKEKSRGVTATLSPYHSK